MCSSVSAMRPTPWARACSRRASHERSAESPTSSSSSLARQTSSACLPIEPVAPRISRRLAADEPSVDFTARPDAKAQRQPAGLRPHPRQLGHDVPDGGGLAPGRRFGEVERDGRGHRSRRQPAIDGGRIRGRLGPAPVPLRAGGCPRACPARSGTRGWRRRRTEPASWPGARPLSRSRRPAAWHRAFLRARLPISRVARRSSSSARRRPRAGLLQAGRLARLRPREVCAHARDLAFAHAEDRTERRRDPATSAVHAAAEAKQAQHAVAGVE